MDQLHKKVDFVISGSQRSGTTLLAALLSEAEDMLVVNDPHLFIEGYNYATMFRDRAALSKYIEQIIRHHETLESKGNFDVGYSAGLRARSGWLTEESPIPTSLVALYPRIVASMQPKNGPAIRSLGVKEPDRLTRAAYHFRFRNELGISRFIFLVRDPAIQCASYMHYLNEDASRAVQRLWGVYTEDYLSMLLAGGNLVIRYEDLVRDTDDVLKRTYTYLDVPIPDLIGSTKRFEYYTRTNYIGNEVDETKNHRRLNSIKKEDIGTLYDRTAELRMLLGYGESRFLAARRTQFRIIYYNRAARQKLSHWKQTLLGA